MKRTTKPTLTLFHLWRIAALCLVLMALPAATYGQKKKTLARSRTTQKAAPASGLAAKLTKGIWVEPDGLIAYIFDAGGRGSYLTSGVSNLTWRVISANRAVVKTYSGTDTLVVANGETSIGRWRTPLRQLVFADAAYKAALRKTRAAYDANGGGDTWPPFCYVDVAANLLGREWKENHPETSGGETWTFSSSTKGERRVHGHATKFSWKVLPGNVLQLTMAGGKVEKYPLERVYTGSISALLPAFKTRVPQFDGTSRDACFMWGPEPDEMMEAYLADYFDLWRFFREPQPEALGKLGKEWPYSKTKSEDGIFSFWPYTNAYVSAINFRLYFENGKLDHIFHVIEDLTLEQRKALVARFSKNAEKTSFWQKNGYFVVRKYGMEMHVFPDLDDAGIRDMGMLIYPKRSR